MEPNPNSNFTTCEHCNRVIRTDYFAIHSARCLPKDIAANKPKKNTRRQQIQQLKQEEQIESNWREEEKFACYLCRQQFSVSSLDAHMQECPNRQVECQNCGEMVPHRQLLAHQQECAQQSQLPSWLEEDTSITTSEDRPGTQYSILPLNTERTSQISSLRSLEHLLEQGIVRSMLMGDLIQMERRIMYLYLLRLQIRVLATSVRQPNTSGLTQAQIMSIPNKTYLFDGRNKDDCAICCTELAHKQEIKSLECRHLFHTQCLKQWLLINKICPLCKRQIKPPLAPEASNRSRQEISHANRPGDN